MPADEKFLVVLLQGTARLATRRAEGCRPRSTTRLDRHAPRRRWDPPALGPGSRVEERSARQGPRRPAARPPAAAVKPLARHELPHAQQRRPRRVPCAHRRVVPCVVSGQPRELLYPPHLAVAEEQQGRLVRVDVEPEVVGPPAAGPPAHVGPEPAGAAPGEERAAAERPPPPPPPPPPARRVVVPPPCWALARVEPLREEVVGPEPPRARVEVARVKVARGVHRRGPGAEQRQQQQQEQHQPAGVAAGVAGSGPGAHPPRRPAAPPPPAPRRRRQGWRPRRLRAERQVAKPLLAPLGVHQQGPRLPDAHAARAPRVHRPRPVLAVPAPPRRRRPARPAGPLSEVPARRPARGGGAAAAPGLPSLCGSDGRPDGAPPRRRGGK